MRWTAKRKRQVVDAIRNGEMTQADAIARYNMSEAELSRWFKQFSANMQDVQKQLRDRHHYELLQNLRRPVFLN